MDATLLSQIHAACKAADLETIRKIRALEDEEKKASFGLKGLLFAGVSRFGKNRRLRAAWITERVLANGQAIIARLHDLNVQLSEELIEELIDTFILSIASPKDAFELWHDDFKTIRHHEGEKGIEDEWKRLGEIGNETLGEVLHLFETEMLKQETPSKEGTTVNNFNVSGQNSRINYGSTDNSTNTVSSDGQQAISKLVEISKQAGDAELVDAAHQVQRNWPAKESTLSSLTKWVTLAGGMAKVMHEASPILHDLYKYVASL